ncbi:MAG: tetratricopeptide repeat protein [Flavobacteriaceae bacterium]
MKNILYIVLLFVTIGFSQNEKTSKNDSIKAITTKAKNYIKKGNELYQKGLYVEAESAYKEAIVLNPNYDKANYNYGNTQFLQNKIKEAKAQYDKVLKTSKDEFVKADSYHNIGNIAMKEKQYAQAIDAYKNTLRRSPNDDETRYNLALAQKLLKEEQQKDKDKKDKKEDKDDKQKDKEKKDDKGDKDKEDKSDKDKDEKKDDKNEKGKDDKEKQEKPQPKPQKSKLTPDQVKQLLEAMNKKENETQQKMNAKKERGRKVKQEKDW